MPCPGKYGISNTNRVLEARIMADHSEVAYTTADGNDYPAHEEAYEGFLKLTKYTCVTLVVILALMAIFLT
ncbi:hypothetical protein GCM10022626_17900 [[Pseudomonas] carboxydohydrogena]